MAIGADLETTVTQTATRAGSGGWGAVVALTDHTAASAQAAAQALAAEGLSVQPFKLDVSDPAEIATMVEQIARRLGEPASADVLREHGGFPATEEADRLLDPARQTERGSIGGGGG